MKKFLLAAVCVLLMASMAKAAEEAKFHIGICTGTVSQSEDSLRGAEELIKRYGDVIDGGIIKHITYPDNFMTEQETIISQIAGLADDPLTKAIVVNQAIPGTTEAFRRVHIARPDILLFAGQAAEDPGVITSVADLVIQSDCIARGYIIVLIAQKLGCTDFVHISFPRHMSYELISRRARIMEEACKDLGVKYHFETAPDPTSDVGIAGAQQFILEKIPQWIEKYGENTAFFCTNDAETEPLLKRIAEGGKGYFIEADLPSPLMGYPGALGVDLADVAGDFPAILKRVESAVIEKGGAGRMGTWAYSHDFTTSYALAEYAISCINKGISGTNFRRSYKKEDVLAAFANATPGAKWSCINYVDASSGLELRNLLMLAQDNYIFGKGYMNVTEEIVPEKYLKLK